MTQGRLEEGHSVVEGIAIGPAIVWAGDPPARDELGTPAQEHTRLLRAIGRATRGVRDLADVALTSFALSSIELLPFLSMVFSSDRAHGGLTRTQLLQDSMPLRDWLRLLSFEVESGRFGCYIPPVTSARWLQRFAWMENAGDRWWPIAGGVYVVRAVKRTIGMRLVMPSWRSQAVSSDKEPPG